MGSKTGRVQTSIQAPLPKPFEGGERKNSHTVKEIWHCTFNFEQKPGNSANSVVSIEMYEKLQSATVPCSSRTADSSGSSRATTFECRLSPHRKSQAFGMLLLKYTLRWETNGKHEETTKLLGYCLNDVVVSPWSLSPLRDGYIWPVWIKIGLPLDP